MSPILHHYYPYIPIFSTFQSCAELWRRYDDTRKPLENPSRPTCQLNRASTTRLIVMAIPILGNLGLALYDWLSWRAAQYCIAVDPFAPPDLPPETRIDTIQKWDENQWIDYLQSPAAPKKIDSNYTDFTVLKYASTELKKNREFCRRVVPICGPWVLSIFDDSFSKNKQFLFSLIHDVGDKTDSKTQEQINKIICDHYLYIHEPWVPYIRSLVNRPNDLQKSWEKIPLPLKSDISFARIASEIVPELIYQPFFNNHKEKINEIIQKKLLSEHYRRMSERYTEWD